MRGSSACRPPRTRAKTSKSLSGTSANTEHALPHAWGSAPRSGAMGLLLGVLTFAVYMVGSNRSFGYDAAATFANFIATPSLLDAFAFRSVIPTIPVTQVATNDHVLLSLASHVIFSLTGSRSEVVYRLLPGLAAGATVGLSTAVLTRQFGLIAGLCAGVFLVCHVAWIATRRSRSDLLRLLPAWAGAAAIGIAANATIYFEELTRHGLPPPLFNPTFPRDLGLFLVGAPVLLPVALW